MQSLEPLNKPTNMATNKPTNNPINNTSMNLIIENKNLPLIYYSDMIRPIWYIMLECPGADALVDYWCRLQLLAIEIEKGAA